MGIFSFILGNKQLVEFLIVAAVLLGAFTYIKILKSELATAVAEKAVLTTDLGISQNAVKRLQDAINDQNTAITKLKIDADLREASHAADIAKAKASSVNYGKQADAIMKLKAPNGKPVCVAADDLINQELKNAK